jgi:periplasmic protein CpxP/Spy
MNKEKFWKLAAIALLIINIATVYMVFFNPFGPPKGRAIAHFLVRQLDFDNEQRLESKVSADKHRFKADSLRIIEVSLHNRLFELMKSKNVDSVVLNKTIIGLGKTREGLELNTFWHFHQFRDICNPTQQQKFDVLIREVLDDVNASKKK